MASFIGSIEYFLTEEDFEIYKERFKNLLKLNKITDDKAKLTYFITFVGPDIHIKFSNRYAHQIK